MYTQYKSPLGYMNGDNNIDSYGVDHSGFSTRDELEYQMARVNRENDLIKRYNRQGITKNYPQYGTNFWKEPLDDIYGLKGNNPSSNLTGSPYLVAQNNMGNTVNDGKVPDAVRYSGLIDHHYRDAYSNEGAPDYVYLDTHFNRTVGRGENINKYDNFSRVNFKVRDDGRLATEEEKKDCYNAFNNWIKKHKIGDEDEHNYKAPYFETYCDLYIEQNEAQRLHSEHVLNDIPSLRQIINNFDDLSYNKQLAIVDMVYNMEPERFKEKFPNFIDAARRNDTKYMIKEHHRTGISEKRNKWVRELLEKDLN